MNSKTLIEMSKVEINKVDPSTLADINTISINQALPHEEKILSYIRQMGNPYCFMSGGIPVRVRFTGEGKKLSQSLVDYFTMLKQRC
ncbi:MAG: hypothetical protein LBI03_08985 [Clostridiales bacterium]|jgi:hypothetical protein|nr:hypothetical protein [Clostridiales bacterium]